MKKLIALTLTLIALLTLTAPALAEDSEFVEIFTVVIDFDYDRDVVVCLAEDGTLWEFYEIEDTIIGDKMILTVWTVTDEIVNVRYIGWMNIYDLSHYVVDICG